MRGAAQRRTLLKHALLDLLMTENALRTDFSLDCAEHALSYGSTEYRRLEVSYLSGAQQVVGFEPQESEVGDEKALMDRAPHSSVRTRLIFQNRERGTTQRMLN